MQTSRKDHAEQDILFDGKRVLKFDSTSPDRRRISRRIGKVNRSACAYMADLFLCNSADTGIDPLVHRSFLREDKPAAAPANLLDFDSPTKPTTHAPNPVPAAPIEAPGNVFKDVWKRYFQIHFPLRRSFQFGRASSSSR